MSFVFAHDFFPVPLVHVDGVYIVQVLFVGAYGVHVGVDAFSGVCAQLAQLEAFPFCQGMHDFGPGLLHGQYLERDRALDAVEVVVDTGALQDKQRGGDPAQVEFKGEVVLKMPLYLADGVLGLQLVKQRLISWWYV